MKTIVVVGVGALGSHVVQFCRSLGVNVRIIDFDRVEQKNTLSQFHGRPSVNKLKVASLAGAMNFLFGVKVEANSNELTELNVNQLLGKSDLIVDCLDNGAARRVVQGYARRTGTPCIHGALAADGTFGRVIWDESFVIDDEAGAGQATCENGEHLPFIVIVSGYLARAIQEFFQNGRKLGYQVHPGGASRA